MDKLDLYYDYYKDTYDLSKQAQKSRNKMFVWLCILEALSFFLLVKPDKAIEMFTVGINTHFETDLVFGNVVLQTLLWVLIAYITVRYCQSMLYVERQYLYLKQLEKEISRESNSTLFNREGQEYVRDYPIVLNLIDLFYKMFCPILFMVINTVRIIKEWNSTSLTLALICDTVVFFVVFIITWFYFFEIHSKITAWCKKHILLINYIANVLHKILKEV